MRNAEQPPAIKKNNQQSETYRHPMFGNDVNLPIPTGFPTGTEVWRSDRSNPHSALPGDAVNITKGVKAIVNGMVTSSGKLDLDKTLGRTKTTDIKLSDIRKVGMQGIMY